jgi:hypothetical protein
VVLEHNVVHGVQPVDRVDLMRQKYGKQQNLPHQGVNVCYFVDVYVRVIAEHQLEMDTPDNFLG